MAQSSIHIEQGHIGYLFHNDRSKSTVNSIFFDEKNEYSCTATQALEIYRQELQKRTEAYTARTKQKLQKKVQTHLSAIVNLNKEHTLQDLQPLISYLEQTLDTKIFQVALHKDEGHIEYKAEEKKEGEQKQKQGKIVKNYHAHIEFLGLDSTGKSIRRKLTRKYLIELQTKTAELLKMQRGKNYTKQRAKRPKRLNTYEYKQSKKQNAHYIRAVTAICNFAKQEFDFEVKNEDTLIKFFNKIKEQKEQETEQEQPKQQEQQQGFIDKIFDKFAKQKDLKEQNKILREKLKENKASRAEYAELEALNKQLKEQIKNKDLTISQLQKQMQKMQNKLLAQIAENKQLKKQLQMQPTPTLQPAEPKIVYQEKIVEVENTGKQKELEDKLKNEREQTKKLKEDNNSLKEQNGSLKSILSNLALLLKCEQDKITEKVQDLLNEGKRLNNEIDKLRKDVKKLKEKKSKKKGMTPS